MSYEQCGLFPEGGKKKQKNSAAADMTSAARSADLACTAEWQI